MHWNGDWGSGWIWGMHLVGWLFWVIVAIGIWWAITRTSTPSSRSVDETPLELLRRRYADGALTTEEYEERRKVLLTP
jgi:putative membrane protein